MLLVCKPHVFTRTQQPTRFNATPIVEGTTITLIQDSTSKRFWRYGYVNQDAAEELCKQLIDKYHRNNAEYFIDLQINFVLSEYIVIASDKTLDDIQSSNFSNELQVAI